MAAIITNKGDLYYDVREQETFKGMAMVRLIQNAVKTFKKPLFLLWDNASIHKSEPIKLFLEQQTIDKKKLNIHLGFIPPYSPELNPIEQLWAYMKSVLLKNLFCKTVKELKSKVIQALETIKNDKNLIISFFKNPKCNYILN